MAILVVNAGSSSLKLSLFSGSHKAEKNVDGNDASELRAHIDGLVDELRKGGAKGEIKIEAVGHRVVHGGPKYAESVLVDAEVMKDLHAYIELDPSHEAANIKGIEVASKALPDAKHAAVFDTAYHHNMPLAAQVYAGPYSWYEKRGIRRYGFHGINHKYCVERTAALIQGTSNARVITCHLGSGGSLCASLDGHSVMTTMGYTPLEGLVMRTRSGSIDPGLILVLLKHGYTGDQLNKVLNEESGLKGICGLEGDMRKILKEKASGNERAALAFDIYIQSLTSGIAALVPTLGGLDVLVFTGGIGENAADVREAACARLAFLGVSIDKAKNHATEKERDISSAQATVKTMVIAAGEDLAIARECARLCGVDV